MAFKHWISAFRLQTLPLAFSCIFMGAALSFSYSSYSWTVFSLSLVTTLLLQVLSNLANDYGDAEKGTDNENRLGPKRAVQSGDISAGNMKNAVIVVAVLSFISGLTLLWVAFGRIDISLLFFVLLGIGAIAAAIKYTMGKSAYGYRGLGDLFVFLFFGLIGVIGSMYLQSKTIDFTALLPAATIGLFSTGVLNLNNLRDIENDKESGKNTIVVLLGKKGGAVYHLVLLSLGWSLFMIYLVVSELPLYNLSLLVLLPIFIRSGKMALFHSDAKELIPELKRLALATFLFSFFYFSTQLLAHV
jgi:1,4-dihydroxy-2-naphthoate octaprenyltransferase